MRRITPWLVVALLAPAPAAGAPSPRTKVAVLDLRAIGVEASLAELLSEVALTEAASLPYLEVIGRSDIQAMLGFEKQKKMLGCEEDSACIAEIGGALGVKLVLVGSVGKIGALYRLDLKAIDSARPGSVRRKGVNVEGAEEKMVAGVQGAVRDLFRAEAEAAGAPVAAAATAPPPAAPAAATESTDAAYMPRDPRWLFGIRLAYAGPGGEFQKGTSLNDLVGGAGVLQLEASYRITDRLRLGGFVSRGDAQAGKDFESGCEQDGVTCAFSFTRIGLEIEYEFAGPTSTLVPWVGAGVGFEFLDLKAEGQAGGEVTASASGWEAFNAEVGLDVRIGWFRVGPYVTVAVGRYSDGKVDLTAIGGGTPTDTLDVSNHSWFHLGLRGALEL